MLHNPKHAILILAFSILSVCSLGAKAPGKVSTPASDKRVTFLGRTLVEGDNVSFDWSGVYARVRFSGNYLAMKASDTRRNYYNVWIDSDQSQEPDRIISTHGADSLIVLFDESDIVRKWGKAKSAPTVHNVVIQKRTEGEQGTTTVSAFITEGQLLQAEGVRERLIEVIGDSYTCGYGTENSVKTDPFKVETENCNKSYSSIVPRYFGADYIHVAHSGMGIARNYNDNVKGWYMPERYLQTFDMDRESRWDAAKTGYHPDITIIYLGANDFSVQRQPTLAVFMEGYITLLKEIKANWGEDHPILCVAGPSDFNIAAFINEVVRNCGLKNVSMTAMSSTILNDDSDLGASYHPNYSGHKKVSMCIIPVVATKTGWDLTGAPIE